MMRLIEPRKQAGGMFRIAARQALRRASRPAILLVLSCMVTVTTAQATQIWFGAVNAPVVGHNGRPSSRPGDFMELFTPSAPWSRAAKTVSVLEVSTRFFLEGTDGDLSVMFKDLKRRHIALAIGLGFLDVPNCGKGVEGFAYPTTAAVVARRVSGLGGELNYLAMDEPLFFGHRYDGPNSCRASIDEIARRVAVHVKEMRQVFPKLQIGDIEPIGSMHPQDTVDEIMQWTAAYRAAMGEPLAFLHADVQWGRPWQQELRLLAESLRSAHVNFGVIYDGDGSDTTGSEWVRRAENRLIAVEDGLALLPDQAILESWNRQPERNLPETDPGTITYLVNRYAAAPSHIAVQRAGTGVSGRLTDGAGNPIVQATVQVLAAANGRTAIMVPRKLGGVVPPGADSAVIGLRINDECGCAGPADVTVGTVVYRDDHSGQTVQRQLGRPGGATPTAARFVAVTGQKAGGNTLGFPVTPGDPFTVEVPLSVTCESDEHGTVAIIFLNRDGRGVLRDSLPFHPSTEPVGTTVTDASGRFSLPLNAALRNASPSYLAEFDGNDQYRRSSGLLP
jgi:hypothetical protein